MSEELNKVFEGLIANAEETVRDCVDDYTQPRNMGYSWVSIELLVFYLDDKGGENWAALSDFCSDHPEFNERKYDWFLAKCKEIAKQNGIFVTDVNNMTAEDEEYLNELDPDWQDI